MRISATPTTLPRYYKIYHTAQTLHRFYTPEEYLALEAESPYKNEYRNGEIIPMSGGTTNHNKIALNFCRAFPLTFDGQDYEVYMGDVRLWIPDRKIYTYPDIMIIRGEPVYQGQGTTTFTNPIVVIEVFSPCTQGYDRGDKFKAYRSIPSFQEYLLIDPYSFYVEQFAKDAANKWSFAAIEGADATLSLASINFAIALSTLYQRVQFEPHPEPLVSDLPPA